MKVVRKSLADVLAGVSSRNLILMTHKNNGGFLYAHSLFALRSAYRDRYALKLFWRLDLSKLVIRKIHDLGASSPSTTGNYRLKFKIAGFQ